MLSGQAVPPAGFRVVLRHAPTGVVHEPEVVLGVGVTLRGGQAVPPDGFRVVLRHAQAGGVHESEVGLCAGVTLLSGQAVPPDGFRVVLRHAPTGVVHEPEGVLGVGVTLFSRVPCRVVLLGTGWRDREQDNGGRAGHYPADLQRADPRLLPDVTVAAIGPGVRGAGRERVERPGPPDNPRQPRPPIHDPPIQAPEPHPARLPAPRPPSWDHPPAPARRHQRTLTYS